jgi:hypothetical protein
MLFVFLTILALSVSVLAQDDEEEESEKWRDFEVTLGAGLGFASGDFSSWNDTLGAKLGINLGGSGGYYFTERICLGAYFNYFQFDLEEPANGMDVSDVHYKLYNIGLYAKYALSSESNFEPYIKLMAGITYPKFATWTGATLTRLREVSYDPEISGGIHLGALYYTSEYGGIFLEAGYHLERTENNIGDSFGVDYKMPYNVNYIQVSAGVMVFLGPE